MWEWWIVDDPFPVRTSKRGWRRKNHILPKPPTDPPLSTDELELKVKRLIAVLKNLSVGGDDDAR